MELAFLQSVLLEEEEKKKGEERKKEEAKLPWTMTGCSSESFLGTL